MSQMLLFEGRCQRWLYGQHSWRHTSEGGFDPARYRVVSLDETTAKDFVVAHHYSRSYPAARLRFGLVEGGHLVGVAVLGVPMSKAVLTRRFPTLVAYQESLELSRLILLDEVPANAESWFVARVFDAAAGRGLRGVVAFCDPAPRHLGGRLLMPGHVGTVYQALNATYTGRATARTLTVLPDGTVLNDRSAQKVRAGERGAGGVRARLQALGAPVGAPLEVALEVIGARRVWHRGNHVFVWSLGSRAQRRWAPIGYRGLPYPKTPDPALT